MRPDDAVLPCDVHLPPNTFIGKGCNISTVLASIKIRETFPEASTRFSKLSPSPAMPGNGAVEAISDDALCAEVERRGFVLQPAPLPDRGAAPPPAALDPVGDFYLVPREIIDQFPEINVNNYDHDDACALNAWGCEVVTNATPAGQPAVTSTVRALPEIPDDDADFTPE